MRRTGHARLSRASFQGSWWEDPIGYYEVTTGDANGYSYTQWSRYNDSTFRQGYDERFIDGSMFSSYEVDFEGGWVAFEYLVDIDGNGSGITHYYECNWDIEQCWLTSGPLTCTNFQCN